MSIGAAVRTAALALWSVAMLANAAGAGDAGYTFTILRGDSPIGTHRVTFTRGEDRLTVDSRTDVVVKIAFVTVYRYTQIVHEVWKGDRLDAFDARTDDNGTSRRVQARATPAGLEIEGPGGKLLAPADSFPTGYWNRDIVKRSQAVDSRGRLAKLAFAPQGRKTVTVEGRQVEADIYKIGGDTTGEVGYGPDGSWVSLIQLEQGNVITYIRDGGAANK